MTDMITDRMVEAAAWAWRRNADAVASEYGFPPLHCGPETQSLIRNGMRVALTAALDEAWRPIEEAPKDGTEVLLYYPDCDLRLVGWHNGVEDDPRPWKTLDGPFFSRDDFSHFAPLPAPPKVTP